MLLLSPGHHAMLLAIPFILEMPGCPSCSWCKTRFCPFLGIITRFPHSTHPFSTESSLLRLLNCFISSSSPCFQPCSTSVRTFDSNGSLSVHWRMSLAVIGEAFSVSISRMISAGCGVLTGGSGSGRRLRESALAWSSPGL